VEAVCSSTVFVPTYKSTWHHNPEEYQEQILLLFVCNVHAIDITSTQDYSQEI
jgi:hypothetical protein